MSRDRGTVKNSRLTLKNPCLELGEKPLTMSKSASGYPYIINANVRFTTLENFKSCVEWKGDI